LRRASKREIALTLNKTTSEWGSLSLNKPPVNLGDTKVKVTDRLSN
jgi:hypothetical protein